MTRRDPFACIRWAREYSAWGLTSTAEPNDMLLFVNWRDAIDVANNGFMAPIKATITVHPAPDNHQPLYRLDY